MDTTHGVAIHYGEGERDIPGDKYTEKSKTKVETTKNTWGRPEEDESGEAKKETEVKVERKVEKK